MRSIEEDKPLARDQIFQLLTSFPIDLLKIYPTSFCFKNDSWYGLLRTAKAIKLAVLGTKRGVLSDPFQGDCYHQTYSLKMCDLSKENTGCLMDLFPYAKPTSLRSYPLTLGIGDRLGLAIPGYIRTIRKFEAHLVLETLDENGGTGRNSNQVVPDLAWSIFQENYQEGYGAGRDPLNSLQEIRRALDSGASAITLDLAGRIDPEVLREPEELVDRKFREEIDEDDAKVMLHLFLDKEFVFRGSEGQCSIRFDEQSVKRNALLSYKALDFIEEVYESSRILRKNQTPIDFGISLEKTPFRTSPEHHFFLALELSHRGVRIQFLAPQFEESQDAAHFEADRKGFNEQFYRHVLIAEDYGYKISIQGNSRSPLPYDARGLAKGFLHLRLPDVSWLEAMRLVALFRPALYREMHSFSLSELNDKSKFQHADLKRIPELKQLSDEDLPALLDQEDCRERFQIAFEALLNASSLSGEYLFRNKLYDTLNRYEEDYWSLLEASIERDLSALGVKKKAKTRWRK